MRTDGSLVWVDSEADADADVVDNSAGGGLERTLQGNSCDWYWW
jgi:hypothetical protein